MVGGLLKELRAARDGTRFDDLFGTIGIGPTGTGYEDLAEARPLNDVSVLVSGSTGMVFFARTDEQGANAFSSLPQGTNNFEPELLAGLSSRRTRPGKRFAIEVEDKDGT